MSHVDKRTRDVPPEIAQAVRAELEQAGANAAARALGVDRSVVLAVAAGQKIMPGSIALIRENMARRGVTGPSPVQPVQRVDLRGRGGIF